MTATSPSSSISRGRLEVDRLGRGVHAGPLPPPITAATLPSSPLGRRPRAGSRG